MGWLNPDNHLVHHVSIHHRILFSIDIELHHCGKVRAFYHPIMFQKLGKYGYGLHRGWLSTFIFINDVPRPAKHGEIGYRFTPPRSTLDCAFCLVAISEASLTVYAFLTPPAIKAREKNTCV